jgi:hypothetical protein
MGIIDWMWIRIPFVLPASILFLVPAMILFLLYVSSPQYQTAVHMVSFAQWLFLTLAYVLGSMAERRPSNRFPRLLAIASSLVSLLLFALWFALTLKPLYIVHFLQYGWQFHFIPCIIYNLTRIGSPGKDHNPGVFSAPCSPAARFLSLRQPFPL